VSDESGGSRIILPGGVKPGTLLGPDGRPISTRRDEPEAAAGPALPQYPRLRAIEVQEVREGDRTLIVGADHPQVVMIVSHRSGDFAPL